jgi:type IV pilus assembly protein PilA
MKTELKAKFLQHLASNRKNQGFTLIELLVVVIIIGILAAIALPSMLNQSNKAKEAGAKTALGAINRAQQAYQLETNTFAATFDGLKIGTPAIPEGYDNKKPTIKSASSTAARAEAKGVGAGLTSYCGYVDTDGTGTNAVTTAKIEPALCP